MYFFLICTKQYYPTMKWYCCMISNLGTAPVQAPLGHTVIFAIRIVITLGFEIKF